MAAERWIGAPMPRREDDLLVRGAALFVNDLRTADGLPASEALALVIVRSPFAHARIAGLDATAALDLPGVVAVVSASDFGDEVGSLPGGMAQFGAEVANVPVPLLARGVVRYVGEPVAAVLARSKAVAEDAAELVDVDYEPLKAVVSVAQALEPVAVVHEHVPDNVLVRWEQRRGDVDAAFAAAAHVVRAHVLVPRLAPAPMEVRACVAAYDAASDVITLWASAQDPWRQSDHLAHALGTEREKVHALIPNVGGAFGSKGPIPEYGVAAWCAKRYGATVRYFEDRSENLLASYQGRGMEAEVELSIDANGMFTALRVALLADVGAYLYPASGNVPVTTATLLTGCYVIPNLDVSVRGLATTKVPTGPYRGAGRPEAAFFIERIVDIAASASGIDPVELRRRNFIANDAFPFPNGLGPVYDSGDYGGCLDAALELLDYEAVRAEQASARTDGRLVGLGISTYVERAAPAVWESASATLDEGGRVVTHIGASPHGQGHETTFAQIAADRLGLNPADVEVRHGDSWEGPWGVGTFGSRSVTLCGSAVVLACDELLEQLRPVAAGLLGYEGTDLAYDAGVFTSPAGASVDLAAVGAEAARRGAVLSAEHKFSIERPVFSFGSYLATVEIDPETGKVSIGRIVAVDDAGVVVNPLLAEGQVIGSLIQGIASALFEEVLHDEDGQNLTASFMSYGLPSAPDVAFSIETAFRCTPSPLNPLGAKGLGEAGTIGVPGAIANAIHDALRAYGVVHIDQPYSPEKIWRVLAAGSAATQSA